MAKQKLWEGEKSPIAQLNEDAKALQTSINANIALMEKLKAVNASIQADAKNATIGGKVDKNSLDSLKQLNSEHTKAVDLYRREQLAKRALEQTEKELERQRLSEIRLMQAREKAFDNYERKLAKEEATQTRLSSIYSKVDQKLAALVREYRDLAVRKELNIKLTDSEAKRMDFLATKIQRYDSALKATDANSGKFQRNVGNYASGFNGLGNSVNQLTRELPAFANSMQTGFMAISNNLPIFFDQIAQLKKANIELVKSGQAPQSIFKQLGGAVFSVSSLLSIGVTLLTVYGAKLVEWAASAFGASEEEKKLQEQMKKSNLEKKWANEESQRHAEFIGRESGEMVSYLMQLSLTNQGSKERSRLISEINDKYGTTLKNMVDEANFQAQINHEIDKYIKYQTLRYQVDKNQGLMNKNLETQDKAQREINKIMKEYNEYLREAELNRKSNPNFYKDEIKSLADYRESFNDFDLALSKQESIIMDAQQRQRGYATNLFYTNSELTKYSYKTNESTKRTKDHSDSIKELNLNLKEYNDQLERRLSLGEKERQLLEEIAQIDESERLKKVSKLAEAEFQEQLKYAQETGQVFIDTAEKLVDEEFELRRQALIKRSEFEKSEALKRVDETRVLEYERLTKERDELLKQEGLTENGRLAIRSSYEQRLQELHIRMLEDERLVALEREKIELELQASIGDLNQEKADRLNSINDQIYEAQKTYSDKYNKDVQDANKKIQDSNKKTTDDELRNQKQIADFRKKSIEELIQFQIDKSKSVQDSIDKEISANQKLQDQLKEQANAGVDTAQQSLATLKESEIEATKAKQKEAEKQQALEKIKVAYSLFEQFISKGDNVATATAKTTASMSVIDTIINSFKKFYHGTDDTGTGGMLRDQYGAITGVTHENETVLSKKDKAELGFVSRKDLKEKVQIANTVLYQKQLEVDTSRIGFAQNVAFSLNPLAGKLDKLISIMENQPSQTISEEVVDGIGRAVVATYSKGNDKLTKIYN